MEVNILNIAKNNIRKSLFFQSKVKSNRNIKLIYIFLILLFLVSTIISITTGRYSVTFYQLKEIIVDKILGVKVNVPDAVQSVLFSIRIPRIIVSILVGAALSISGATYQGVFKNPMVSPDILGAVSGAGFGAAISMLFGFGNLGIQISAFIFAILAVIVSYLLSMTVRGDSDTTLVLVLMGLVMGSLFTAGISIIKYVADPDGKLPSITFWLLGGLSTATFNQVIVIIIPIVVSIIPLMLLRYRMNVFSFGDEEAKSMGIDTKSLRLIIISCATILTAVSVSVSGMIGWVGLVIPHVSRLIVGPNNKVLLPISMVIGAIFLLLADDFARSFFAVEIPLGILTAIIGSPFFLGLLLHEGRKEL